MVRVKSFFSCAFFLAASLPHKHVACFAGEDNKRGTLPNGGISYDQRQGRERAGNKAGFPWEGSCIGSWISGRVCSNGYGIASAGTEAMAAEEVGF
jgi:hypothetical protein